MSGGVTRRETIVPVGTVGRLRTDTHGEEIREFLVFGLASERFGLPLASIREILKTVPITEVPRAADDVLGILSVRGRITTVIDLRRRLRITTTETNKASRILLVAGGEEVVGLLVDEVYQVYRLHDDELEYAAVVAGDLSEHVFGIGRPGGGETGTAEEDIIILLDPVSLLRR